MGRGIFYGMDNMAMRSQNLNSQLSLAAAVFDNALEGILVTDAERRIVTANRAVSRATGYSLEEIIGRNPRIFSSGRQGAEFYQRMWESLSSAGQWQGEIWNQRKNGEIYPEWLSIVAIRDDAGAVSNYLAIFTDVTERKKIEDELNRLAHYDALTGLPNRLLFLDRVNHALGSARRDGRQIALLFIDLDRFKAVNDNFGHAVGDQLLAEVARRLQESVRSGDTVARFSGDEFCIVMDYIADPEQAARLAQKLIRQLTEPVVLDNTGHLITASIGISLYPTDGDDADTLLRNADMAMYQVKQLGRSDYQFYVNDLSISTHRNLKLEYDLRSAVGNDELLLHYQPKISLLDDSVVGLEALLRWRHPARGMVPPGEFIPLAEESGLILDISEWVIWEVCRQLREWKDAGMPVVRTAVNISGRQIVRPLFMHGIERAVAVHGVNPDCIELELTESILMDNTELTIAKLQRLRSSRFHLSIDDFGTGYSSLAYIKRFDIDDIKIDRSFIRDITSDPNDAAIVKAIIAMAQKLNLSVVAEGVETEEQVHFLRECGCDQAQGFYWSKPLPADEAMAFVRDWQDRTSPSGLQAVKANGTCGD